MQRFKRNLLSSLKSVRRSFLLLGPRQTGKSTLIQGLHPRLTINLAHEPTFLDFSSNPFELESRLTEKRIKTVFIDEIQRLPSLLNTIQTLIDNPKKQIQFYLTGSSARKLKRGQANLLPGRLLNYEIGPLCSSELDYGLDNMKALSTGTLPGIYAEEDQRVREKILKAYSATYLKEEIQAEALTRNIEGFSRFIFTAAAFNGQLLDYSKLCSEAQVSRSSVVRYIEILEDTMIIQRCERYAQSERKRLIQHPKYYFFDTGVLNGLLRNFNVSNDRKGVLFETLFFNQLMSGSRSKDIDIRVSHYRTEHGAEVDFIVEKEGKIFAVEVKASKNVGKSDLNGFKSFDSFVKKKHQKIIAYMGNVSKKINGIEILPWQEVLKKIGL